MACFVFLRFGVRQQSIMDFETGVFSKKDHYVHGILSSIFFMFVAVFAAFFYWW
ncbi:hypothetical protein [Ornithinibacillus xuwenensis]|uniref:Uncharacterized protein n=1 Tax=Ornithinibacillus xuwenensis TaxID=3144668 RepID=A0ABU9XJX4_9BACI